MVERLTDGHDEQRWMTCTRLESERKHMVNRQLSQIRQVAQFGWLDSVWRMQVILEHHFAPARLFPGCSSEPYAEARLFEWSPNVPEMEIDVNNGPRSPLQQQRKQAYVDFEILLLEGMEDASPEAAEREYQLSPCATRVRYVKRGLMHYYYFTSRPRACFERDWDCALEDLVEYVVWEGRDAHDCTPYHPGGGRTSN